MEKAIEDVKKLFKEHKNLIKKFNEASDKNSQTSSLKGKINVSFLNLKYITFFIITIDLYKMYQVKIHLYNAAFEKFDSIIRRQVIILFFI